MRALEWNTNFCPNCRSFFEILDHWRRLYSKYSHLTQLINYLEYFLTQMTNIYIYILMQLYFPNRFNFPLTKTKWYDCREWDVWSLRTRGNRCNNSQFNVLSWKCKGVSRHHVWIFRPDKVKNFVILKHHKNIYMKVKKCGPIEKRIAWIAWVAIRI